MKPRARKILTIIIIIIIIIGIGLGTYYLFFNNKDNGMYIRRISAQEIVNYNVSDFSNSRLRIYKNGAFEIEIIQKIGEEQKTLFVGIGRYVKTRSAYTFTYADSYTRIGTQLEQSKNYSVTYPIESGRVRFDASWGISYYFG